MPDYLFDQAQAKEDLKDFFSEQKEEINNFGSTVNQTFEAFVFANVIKWYEQEGWFVFIENPVIKGEEVFKLKFNTRGKPSNYSYASCSKDDRVRQIRHGLRVKTKSYKSSYSHNANIVCDIVIMNEVDLEDYSTDHALPNHQMLAFGEVKHMSAYAELIASFIGLTFELRPEKLKRIRIGAWERTDEICCFLNVSGLLFPTAKGIIETIEKRKYDIDIYSFENEII